MYSCRNTWETDKDHISVNMTSMQEELHSPWLAEWAPADQAHNQLSLAHWWHLYLIQPWSTECLCSSAQPENLQNPINPHAFNRTITLPYVRFFGISVQKLYFIHPPKHGILVQVGTQTASKTTIKRMRMKFPFSFPRQSGEAERLLKLSLAQLWCSINGVLPHHQWSSFLCA